MAAYIVIGVAVVVVLLFIVIATRPADFRITRSTAVSAPAAVVFAQVNDFHKWNAWNPWDKADPTMKKTYEGPASGPGAIYSWVGNKNVGEGRMTITDARLSELVRIKLEFFKPMAATSTAEFTFKPDGNQTVATWSMFGKNNFMAKAFHMCMNMDKMIGGQFEKGLADMKAAAEAAAK